MTTWSDWRARHPGTTVLSPRTGFARDYADAPYGPYFETDELMFPVEKQLRRKVERLKNKDPVVLVSVGGEMKAYAREGRRGGCEGRGYVEDFVGGRRSGFIQRREAEELASRLPTASRSGSTSTGFRSTRSSIATRCTSRARVAEWRSPCAPWLLYPAAGLAGCSDDDDDDASLAHLRLLAR
jgi:hypothetical protein